MLLFCGQVKSLEAQGIPSKHAEAITSAITEVLDDSLANISQNLISRAEMQRVRVLPVFSSAYIFIEYSKLFYVNCDVSFSFEFPVFRWKFSLISVIVD